MPSPLDYISSDGFRKKLMARNLTPYNKSPNIPSPPITFEYQQSDIAVQNSPDQLIDEPTFANKLYPLNEWGAEGGYKQVSDPTGLLNSISNQGEYGPGQQDAHIIIEGYDAARYWRPLNAYADGLNVFDSAEAFSSLETVKVDQDRQGNGQPYPAGLVGSSYTPVSILLSPDPQGSNGLLSQDSFIARLGAKVLRKGFQDRIARQVYLDTVAKANIFNVRSGTDILNLVTGRVPLIEPNYRITVPSNPILAASDFALRLAGSILPVSEIPGSYFDPSVNNGQPTTIQQINAAYPSSTLGNLVSSLLGGGQTGSQIMYNNMGSGQKSRLFGNIDYNRYKPSFDRTLFDRLGGAIVGSTTDNSNYYIGSINSEPSNIFSPAGSQPINSYGIPQKSPVFGPSELAQLYEGPSKSIRLAANGPTYSNGGGIEGGFTWVSPKYKDNAGFTVGIGGVIINQSNNKPSSYNSTESTNNTFKDGSILDKTQRIIDSQPQGAKRLQHAGNAIDQVSKVFNDGYKELTKGSRVITYTGNIGQEVGTEYCRVFAKDIPYLNYRNLQKVDGITVNGRRFGDSVLDNTYNLNIVPNKQEGGQSSTNLINGPGGSSINNAYAKKYMFSLENLAWRTSNTPGFTVSDLSICERGPNGGRVMWFPPYGLNFTESVTANWNTSDFLGRPEPIYTYKNTSRGGTLTWKIVVDHPSILNTIVNKVLSNESNKERVNSIIDSFFAGCRKYDIYELAKKYYTVNPNDLYLLQTAITSKELTREQLIATVQTIQTGYNAPTAGSTPNAQASTTNEYWKKYNQWGFYFGNDYPKKGNVTPYQTEYARYTSPENEQYYYDQDPATKGQTSEFFDTVVTSNYGVMTGLTNDILTQLKAYSQGNITITIDASCSAPASIPYNLELARRRIDSAIQFFTSNPDLKQYIGKRLIVQSGKAIGEVTTSTPNSTTSNVDGIYNPSSFTTKGPFNCTDNDGKAIGGDTPAVSREVFTVPAMACRRAYISSIISNLSQPPTEPTPNYVTVTKNNVITDTIKTQEVEKTWKPRDNITKFVLRSLLSECDYFETVKEASPMVYDNLREKLKFFQPAFHSMTPEGLNTRLTFLQQCMRPGDTIPTIKDIGGSNVLQYNEATNTSFGAPPVLILRIGDFYNTKIIPTTLGITYEELDINPEGIGVQPMIANVTMAFNFVGGSGLKESIDKLQNALTFNYYANTEIYDDRADSTDKEEFLKVLDKQFLQGTNPPSPPALNQAAPNAGQNNNSTIGSILTSNIQASNETGTISYGDFMTKVVADSQTYFTNIFNKNKEVLNQYNNAMRQQWMVSRNYFNGNLLTNTPNVQIFGKPAGLQTRVDEIFVTLAANITNGEEGFIQFISNKSKNFSDRLIKTVKNNYVNYLNNKKSSYQTPIYKTIQDLTNIQQSYIQTLARVNTITYGGETNTGTDGLQAKSGAVKVYVTQGTTDVATSSNGAANTLVELVNDVTKLQQDLISFNDVISSETKFIYSGDKQEYSAPFVFTLQNNGTTNQLETKDVFTPFSRTDLFNDRSFRRVYMLLSDDITDNKKYETFKNALIGNIIGNSIIIGKGQDDIELQFDAYWTKTAKPAFDTETNITTEFLNNLEKDKLKKYLIYTPFDSKKRVFTYNSQPVSNLANKTSQENLIKGLGATGNQNTNKLTWNDANGTTSFGSYISKAKLN
jgi:hypothetical protein